MIGKDDGRVEELLGDVARESEAKAWMLHAYYWWSCGAGEYRDEMLDRTLVSAWMELRKEYPELCELLVDAARGK